MSWPKRGPSPPLEVKAATSSALGGGGDEAVADLACQAGRLFCRRRHHDLDPLRGQRVDARALDGVVAASVTDEAALPEPPQQADCLLQHLEAKLRRGPTLARDVLVQVLPGPDAEEESAFEQRRSRRGRLGDDRWMNADQRTGDTRADP